MKKLLAILTVLCMVITTMIVPTLVFGNEGEEAAVTVGFDPGFNEYHDGTFKVDCGGGEIQEGNSGYRTDISVGDVISNTITVYDPISNVEGAEFKGWVKYSVTDMNTENEAYTILDDGEVYSTSAVLAHVVGDYDTLYIAKWEGIDYNTEPEPEEETVIVGFDPGYEGDYEMAFEGECHEETFDWGYNTDVPLSGTIGDVFSIITEPTSSSEDENFLGWRQHEVIEVEDEDGGYYDFGDPISDTVYTTEEVLAMTPPADGAIFVGVWDGVESSGGEEGEDDGIGFNIWLNANEGFITYTYIDENGVKQTLDTSQIMPGMLETDEEGNYISFEDSLANQGQEILEINKPNHMFKGWKVYSWTNCEVIQDFDKDGIEDDYEAGDDQTSVYIGKWSFGTEEQYDTYLFMDYDPEDSGICSLEDLLSLELSLSDGISGYYAEAQWEECQVVAETLSADVVNVPETIEKAAKEAGQDLVEYIKAELEAATKEKLENAGQASASLNIEYREVELQIKDEDTDKWVEVSDENFPEEGVQIVLKYPDEVADNWEAYEYVVTHMITSKYHPLVADGNHNVGDVEVLDTKATEDGIVATVYSLSPMAIAYQEAPQSDEDNSDQTGGNDNTGTDTPGTTPGNTGNNTAQGGNAATATPDKAVDTGDNFNAVPFIAVMMIALAGVAAALFRRKTQ